MRRMAGIILLGGLVALLGCDATAPVNASDKAGTAFVPAIAFESTRGGNRGIYLANEDGTDVTFLTPGGTEPAWSRDGSQIAYYQLGDQVDYPSDSAGIYVTAPDWYFSRGRYLVSGQEPTWGPGNREIAYRGDGGIFVVAVDGSTPPQKLIGDNATLPRPEGWNPDDHGPGLDSWPVWSPDGNQIAFLRIDPVKSDLSPRLPDENMYVMNADGSNPRLLSRPCNTLTPEALPFPCPITGLSWSPSGSSLAVASYDFDEYAPDSLVHVLGIMPASVDSGSADPVEILYHGFAYGPQWSPDGSSITFTDGAEVLVFSLDTGLRQLIPDAANAVWRPLP